MINYNNLSIDQANALQEQLRAGLRFDLAGGRDFTTIGGADISFNKGSSEFFAAIVLLSFPNMVLQAYALARGNSDFPYVPGYLGFREVPSLLKAWELIPDKPDLLVLDGQGILHPRQMGIAAHFGVLTHHLTIGCAKNSLFGKYETLGPQKYAASPIYGHGGIAGYALRTKDNVQPVFISPGYGIDVPQALAVMRKCIGKYRIPEPTRIAHEVVNQFRKGELKEGFYRVIQQPELF